MHKVQHAVKLEPDKSGSHVVTRIQGRGVGKEKQKVEFRQAVEL